MLKEIKEGHQVTPTLLKRQPDDSQQKPVKHCGIYSCNSYHTDECPQLQEDNTVASTHSFYDATTISPFNGQYYTQGGRDSQPARWIPPQQQQAQPMQPYTYTIRIVQRENQEMRDAQKRTESQLNHLAELLQKIANQSPVNPLAQAHPSAPSPLPSQPLPNPKGGINAIQVEMDNEEEDEAEEEEGENDWLYELLKELANSDEEEDEESEDESEEEDEDEFVEEGDQAEEEAREEDRDKGKVFFINTLFKEKRNEEEVPIKCGDPSPCLITCKIRGVSNPNCLCDPGACGNIMLFEVYELLDIGPLKKSTEVFTTADASIVSVAGIARMY
ncbi:hypothetical protein PIB30_046063 [Stylosanthes scabra]|uniref:Uncharacterized protein n=1 Tax=Stylosanthes scabra TaxID=79078 RepID=A0ABU6SGV0_9FABA|nr:hypothetical protein [Stylosanthes scabra]